MKKADRLKELEKLAEKLGIGQKREVECVSCKKKIQFKDAILLTNKETVSHLCSECNDKLTKGELTKKQLDGNDILKQIEAIERSKQKDIDNDKVPVPYIPRYPGQDDWQRYIEPYRYTYGIGGTGDGTVSYKVYKNTNNSLLKLEPFE